MPAVLHGNSCEPRTVIGSGEGCWQGLAVVGEVFLDGTDHDLDRLSGTGSECLSKTEADQLGDERHCESPYLIESLLSDDEPPAYSLPGLANLVARPNSCYPCGIMLTAP
jgi:hypothetical protein